VPSDASHSELWQFFVTRPSPSAVGLLSSEDVDLNSPGVESIHLIARSNCMLLLHSLLFTSYTSFPASKLLFTSSTLLSISQVLSLTTFRISTSTTLSRSRMASHFDLTMLAARRYSVEFERKKTNRRRESELNGLEVSTKLSSSFNESEWENRSRFFVTRSKNKEPSRRVLPRKPSKNGDRVRAALPSGQQARQAVSFRSTLRNVGSS